MTIRLVSVLLASIAAALLLVGCSKVNKENYDKLKVGMEYKQVLELLGEPNKCDSLLTAKNCTWGTPPRSITVQVVADKVVLFQSEGL